jgi:uncharacterized Zn finger protein (UPF0148 family)
MEFHCPHCQSPIYSRKQKICGVCEKPLPAELLLSENQVAFLKKQDEQVEKRAKEFQLPDPDYGSGGSGMI